METWVWIVGRPGCGRLLDARLDQTVEVADVKQSDAASLPWTADMGRPDQAVLGKANQLWEGKPVARADRFRT